MCVAARCIHHPTAFADFNNQAFLCSKCTQCATTWSVRCIEAFTFSTVLFNIMNPFHICMVVVGMPHGITTQRAPLREMSKLAITSLSYCIPAAVWAFATRDVSYIYHLFAKVPMQSPPSTMPESTCTSPKTRAWGPFTALSASRIALMISVRQENSVPLSNLWCTSCSRKIGVSAVACLQRFLETTHPSARHAFGRRFPTRGPCVSFRRAQL